MWISPNLGCGTGGHSVVNGVDCNSKIPVMRFGLHYVIPFKQHALKLGYNSGIRFGKGSDFDALTLTYHYIWNKPVKQHEI